MTAQALYSHVKKIFEQNGIEDASFEAMCVLEHIFDRKLGLIFLDRPAVLQQQIDSANSIAYKRISGYPLQYILGKWEFYGLPFYVGEGVLIPRQDTECLVQTVIDAACKMSSPEIIDLCSGSGCIAVAVAASIRKGSVSAVEISDKALEYINKNVRLNNVSVNIIKGDVLSSNTAAAFGKADIIACNPPYLTSDDMKNLQREVSFEPETALFGGNDGLDFYRKITGIWKDSLKSGGILAYEIGMGQEKDVSEIMKENNFKNIEMTKDLSGIIRVVRGEKI